MGKDDQEKKKPAAGFLINLGWFQAWGGRAELHRLIPVIIWTIVWVNAVWGIIEIVGALK